MRRMAFSKKLLITDYVILLVLCVCSVLFQNADFTTVIVAWIAQIGVSSAAYYWKAKNENRTKVPINVITSLPKDMRDKLDLTQIITAIIQAE